MRSCINPYKVEVDSINAIIKEVYNALILIVHGLINDQVPNIDDSFHYTSYQETMQNYIVGYMVWLWNLQQVRYVPRLEKHLIFIKQLDNIGHLVNFQEAYEIFQIEQ